MAEFRAAIRAALDEPFDEVLSSAIPRGASGRVDPGRPDPRRRGEGRPSARAPGAVVPVAGAGGAHGQLPARGRTAAGGPCLSLHPPRGDLGRCLGPRGRLRLRAVRSGRGDGGRPAGQALAAGGVLRLQPHAVARNPGAAQAALDAAALPVSLRLRRAEGPARGIRLFPDHRRAPDAGRSLPRPRAVEKPHRNAGEPFTSTA